jgi:hypothetical protein
VDVVIPPPVKDISGNGEKVYPEPTLSIFNIDILDFDIIGVILAVLIGGFWKVTG